MAREIFLVPMVGTGTKTDPFRAKYSDDPAVTTSGSIRSAREGECIAMFDATQTYLDSIAAQSDSMRLATEANIDNALTANQANAAKTFVEARGIPGDFVNQGDTRREAIRAICGLFLFCQRAEGLLGVGFKQRAIQLGVTLATQWNSMPQELRDVFISVRDDHGWNNLGLTGSSSLRQIMLAVSEQFENTPLFIGGFEV